MNEVSDLYDAWVAFTKRRGITAVDDIKWDKAGKAFTAGWLAGFGSLNGGSE